VAGPGEIEDVLEQIVGDIEDEYDFDDSEDNIVREQGGTTRPRRRRKSPISNRCLGCEVSDTDFDTVGGLVVNRFGRLPSAAKRSPSTACASGAARPTAAGCTSFSAPAARQGLKGFFQSPLAAMPRLWPGRLDRRRIAPLAYSAVVPALARPAAHLAERGGARRPLLGGLRLRRRALRRR